MGFDQSNQDGQMHDPSLGLADGTAGSDPSSDFTNGAISDDEQASEFIATEERKPRVSQSTLVMFGVLALSAAGVWVMYQRVGPGRAMAAPSKESVEAKKTITTFLDGGTNNIRSMESLLRNTEKIVQQFLAYPSMTQVPLSDLRTNPFRLRPARPENAPVNDAAERRKREEERVAMLKAVQSLRLQSIMYSETRKACMINDTMYREGDQANDFTIEKVTQTSVIVKSGVYRFELRMQR
jgi:hypothetical protein